MPYLTPPEPPVGRDCRALLIPASSEWLALFGGALTELLKEWNYEVQGISVADTVAIVTPIINDFYAGCMASGCTIEGGYRVIRINRNGRLEQNENGEWVPATDDYYIAPPPAREGGTREDQICLAAKNAINVLHEMYENISESFAEHLSEAEALTALIAFIITRIGVQFAPITWAVAAFFLAVFSLLYAALSYITADLWDENFEKQMVCFLTDCADNSEGVVTFDWQCFNNHLNSLADDFGLTEVQLRLYIQVGFLLYFIGGADALNAAGATTAITDDNCDDCPVEWCVVADFSVEDYGFVSACYNFPTATCDATYGDDTWHDTLGSTGNGVTRFCLTEIQFPQAYHFTRVETDCFVTGTGAPMTMGANIFANAAGGSPNAGVQIPVSNDHYGAVLTLDDDVDYFQFGTNVSPPGGGSAATGHSYTTRVVFRGTGDKPDLPDCED